jgi:vacuolar-type H+-ATPase subunit H
MAANRKELDDLGPAAAQGRLSRLLDTETELDAMLQAAKREAAELVESAQMEAKDRIRRFEMELDAADLSLSDRIARERDEAIAAIRAETVRVTAALDGVSDARIEELAQYVVERVVGPASGGRS